MAFRLTRYKDWLPPLLKKLFAVHGVKTSQERGAVPLEDLPLPRPAIVWNEPWFQIEDAAHQSGLQRELHAEIGPQHPLWGKYPIVFGRSRANDDIAVCLADATFAIVHLVWSGRIDSIPGTFPVTTFCHDLAELQACMDERLDSEENEVEDGGDPHS